mgnify:CR=1 FL=1
MEKETKNLEERFDKEFTHSDMCKTLRFEHNTDECFCIIKQIKQFIHQIYDEAVQEGYERGRLRCLQQGGCREEVKFLIQQFLEAIPEENKMTYQESDSEGTDGEIRGFNACLEEIKKKFEKIIKDL